jgi:hypothetical protein
MGRLDGGYEDVVMVTMYDNIVRCVMIVNIRRNQPPEINTPLYYKCLCDFYYTANECLFHILSPEPRPSTETYSS